MEEPDLTKIEKELTLMNDLKIFELKLILNERKDEYKMPNPTYNNLVKQLNSFRKK